jgi:hypothetical protein
MIKYEKVVVPGNRVVKDHIIREKGQKIAELKQRIQPLSAMAKKGNRRGK